MFTKLMIALGFQHRSAAQAELIEAHVEAMRTARQAA